jgi:hypothetical protein
MTRTETNAARAWRRSLDLTLTDLAKLTGYSPEAVWLFESGHNSKGKPHSSAVWRRWKLACLAVMFLRHYNIETVDNWNWSTGK